MIFHTKAGQLFPGCISDFSFSADFLVTDNEQKKFKINSIVLNLQGM